jgi:MarR family transcriptional regulator, lower aerobic nicotinate degradation pathway regulator
VTLRRVADRPTWLLSRANARAHSILRQAFEAQGVRGYHFRLLAALEQYGPSSQADLGRNTGIDRSDVVATLDDLVSLGFARRAADPADRRRNVVTLTEEGSAGLERLDGVLSQVQEAVLRPLTKTERTTLVDLLTKMSAPDTGDVETWPPA